jgi:arabinogalactan endo-1,4-beta-galactosidase
MVEIGNEISNGFLWPDGQLTWKGQDDEGWQRLSDLLKATEDGVVQGSGSKRKPLILIHLDTGATRQSASRSSITFLLAVFILT